MNESSRVSGEPGSSGRIAWIDVCRGICIVLVVYGHVSGGLQVAGTMNLKSIWDVIRHWVYLFHMPAFFFLSGILAARMSRLSPREFILGRLRTIVYPYIVWTFIIACAQLVMSRFVNNPFDSSRLLRFLVEPYGYGLWFLYSLFIISLLLYLLMRMRIPWPALLLLATVLSRMASFNVFGFWPVLNTSMSFFIYYAAANCAQEKILSLFSRAGWWLLLVFGGGWLTSMTVLYAMGWSNGWFFSLLLAGMGICGVVCLAKSLAQTISVRLWSFLGLFSLEIYLGHPLWGTVSRVLLFHLRINSPTILVLGGVLIGISGSLAVGYLSKVYKFPYLFKWPAKTAEK